MRHFIEAWFPDMPRVFVFGYPSDPFVEILASAGFSVASGPIDDSPVASRRALTYAFRGRPADLVVVDARTSLGLSDIDRARALMREHWGTDESIPLLAVLSADELDGADLSGKVDEFVVSPVRANELLARVGLLLGRSYRTTESNRLVLADLTLDLAGAMAYDSTGVTMSLTPKEYELLHFLMRHRGRFFDRARLLAQVWGQEFHGSDRTVDIHVCRLRSKLPPKAATLLETRRGIGYGFNVRATG